VVRRNETIRFITEKPVLGFPIGAGTSRAHCSSDGTAFYDLTSSSATAGQDLFGISTDGGVKHLLRKLPIDYTNVLVRDFFAGDQGLVTLLEADRRDGGTDGSPPRETDYFMSLEDEAGDVSSLVPLALRFRPVKVARFGSGDVLILGWDAGNELPVLALVKEDGTARRFIDFDERSRDETRNAPGGGAVKEVVVQERATLKALQGAAFVPFGTEVLLTYPGTAKAILGLAASGQSRSIPVSIPAGFVLNDVLVSSGGRGTLVLRVKESDPAKPASDDTGEHPKMRLYEYDAVHGSLIRELVFDKPSVPDVTCAPNSLLTAVFYDTIPDADQSAANAAGAGAAKQLVVSTTHR